MTGMTMQSTIRWARISRSRGTGWDRRSSIVPRSISPDTAAADRPTAHRAARTMTIGWSSWTARKAFGSPTLMADPPITAWDTFPGPLKITSSNVFLKSGIFDAWPRTLTNGAISVLIRWAIFTQKAEKANKRTHTARSGH